MQISTSFQRFFFGVVVDNAFKKLGQIKIPEYKWEDGSEVVLQKHEDYQDPDKLRFFLKIFDEKFPKRRDGNPFSMAHIQTDKVLTHIEYIRYVMSHNGTWLDYDEEEFQRMIKLYET